MDWRPTSNETNDWVPILRNVSFLKIKKIISKYHKNGIVISAIIIITLTLSSNSKKTILASCQSNIYVIKSNVKSLSHSTKKYLAFWIYIFFCLLCKSRKRTNSNFLKKSIICHKNGPGHCALMTVIVWPRLMHSSRKRREEMPFYSI